MPWPKGKPRPVGAGRKKGQPNLITADIKALAQVHGEAAVAALASILTKSEDDKARISAAKELLDRGYGRVTQAVDMTSNGEQLKHGVLAIPMPIEDWETQAQQMQTNTK